MLSLLLAAAVAAADPAAPPPPSPADDRARLEADLAKELGAAPAPQPPGAPPPPPDAARPAPGTAAPPAGQTGANPYARLLLMPDLSAIGRAGISYVAPITGELSPRERPFGEARRVRPVFDELELGLQAVVDPYARADVFLGFGNDGVDVEEAYVTWLTLPYGLQARGGQLFTPFGRVNPQHPHSFEFADKPLVVQRLLAPEALGGPGVAVSWLAPLPVFAELTLAFQSVQPGVDPQTAARQPGGFARLVTFLDVGDRTTVGAGASAGISEEARSGWRDLEGVDVYAKIRGGTTGRYLGLQGELITRGLRDAAAIDAREWGAYAQAVFRPDRRLGYGLRFDRSPAVAPGVERRTSALFLFDPSEFQRIRLQAGWDRLPGGHDGFEALALIEFSIGAHGAHPF